MKLSNKRYGSSLSELKKSVSFPSLYLNQYIMSMPLILHFAHLTRLPCNISIETPDAESGHG